MVTQRKGSVVVTIVHLSFVGSDCHKESRGGGHGSCTVSLLTTLGGGGGGGGIQVSMSILFILRDIQRSEAPSTREAPASSY